VARSLLAACMAFAGVLVLAGAGWALLAGAFLVLVAWRKEPDWRSLASRAGTAARRLALRAKAAPRRAVAMTGMGGGLALLPAGLGLGAGAWAALVAGGALLIGLSLLTGQGA
jgi:hypothetical protein